MKDVIDFKRFYSLHGVLRFKVFKKNYDVLVLTNVAKKWHTHIIKQLECGPMPNVMVALPNIGGAL